MADPLTGFITQRALSASCMDLDLRTYWVSTRQQVALPGTVMWMPCLKHSNESLAQAAGACHLGCAKCIKPMGPQVHTDINQILHLMSITGSTALRFMTQNELRYFVLPHPYLSHCDACVHV